MADYYDDHEEFDEGREPEVVIKKKGGWIGRIVALLLGFLLGIIATVGGVVGGVYYFTSKTTIKAAVNMTAGLTGFTYEKLINDKILSEESAEMSVLQLGQKALQVAQQQKLAPLNDMFPILGKTLDGTLGNIGKNFGIELPTQEVLDTPFNQIPAYLSDKLNTAPLGPIIEASNGGNKLAPVLMELCYGEEDIDYTFENGEVVMLGDAKAVTLRDLSSDPMSMLGKVSLASALTDYSSMDPIMTALALGEENTTFKFIKNKTDVEMKQKFLLHDGKQFLNYKSQEFEHKATDLKNGFFKIEESKTDSNNVKTITETYYVTNDGSGKYYAYKEANKASGAYLFKKTKINALQEDSEKIVNDLAIKDVLGINYKSHKVLISLAYGKKDVHYKIEGTEIKPIGNSKPRTIGDLRSNSEQMINDIMLSDIIDEKQDNAVIMYLLCGKKGIHYTVENGETKMLQKRIAYTGTDKIAYNEYGEEMPKDVTNNKQYQLDVANKKFTDLNGTQFLIGKPVLNKLNVQETVKIGEKTNSVTGETEDIFAPVYYLTDLNGKPVLYEKTCIGDMAGEDRLLTNFTHRLTVSDVLGEDKASGNKILKHLQNSSIDELDDAVLSLKFGDVFEGDVYADAKYTPGENEPKEFTDVNGHLVKEGDYIYTDGDGNICFLPKEQRTLKGTWKYMLCDKNVLTAGGSKADAVEAGLQYSIANDMGKLMDNMSYNVHFATLHDLEADGIIEFENPAFLNRPIYDNTSSNPLFSHIEPYYFEDGVTRKTKLGDLIVDEMLDYLTQILPSE